jgi:hypothetical protein
VVAKPVSFINHAKEKVKNAEFWWRHEAKEELLIKNNAVSKNSL